MSKQGQIWVCMWIQRVCMMVLRVCVCRAACPYGVLTSRCDWGSPASLPGVFATSNTTKKWPTGVFWGWSEWSGRAESVWAQNPPLPGTTIPMWAHVPNMKVSERLWAPVSSQERPSPGPVVSVCGECMKGCHRESHTQNASLPFVSGVPVGHIRRPEPSNTH